MSKLEKFGLFSGILGIIVDSVAIVGYISGLLNFQLPNAEISNKGEAPVLFILLLAIVIIYSWVSISWVLAKRTVVHLESAKKQYSLSKVVARTVLGIGLVIAPMILGWFVITFFDNQVADESPTRKRAIIYATQTAQVMEVPAYATRSVKTQEAGGEVVIQESVDALEQKIYRQELSSLPTGSFTFVFLFPISSIVLGFVVFGIVYQLLPIVYTEILRESDVYDEPEYYDEDEDEYSE